MYELDPLRYIARIRSGHLQRLGVDYYEHEMAGRVIRETRGTGGFGYDVLFVADQGPDDRTSAELSASEKDAISHRGKAIRAIAPLVADVLCGL